MGLDASKLKSDIQGVLDSNPPSVEVFAANLTKAIITYLSGVVIDYPKAPGIFPPPAGPGPDPSFAGSGDATPVVPPASQMATLQGAILSSCKISESSNVRNWAAADAAYIAAIVAIGAAWQTTDGYMLNGATAPGPAVGFNDALATGDSPSNGSKSEVAQAIADAINATTTSSKFTGAYVKGSFVGPGPHSSNLR